MSKTHNANRNQQKEASPVSGKPVRVHIIDWQSVVLTFLLLCISLAVLITMSLLGWLDNVVGSIVTILLGFFCCSLIYDIALLLTACMTVDPADGLMNAGKDPQGNRMVFHTVNVEKLELCDKTGVTISDNTAKHYRKVQIVFHMKSGRTNIRELNYLGRKQLQQIQALIKQGGGNI